MTARGGVFLWCNGNFRLMSGWWAVGEISETSEQKNSRAPILLSLYIGYVNAETLTLFGCGTAGKFGTGNTLLRYGIGTRCAEQPPTVRDAFAEAFGAQHRRLWYGREIRYRKHPPTVRNGHSVSKKAFYGTRRIFWSIRCKKQAFLVREGYSVPETAFSGTRRIFKGALNSLLLHRMHFRKRKNGILLHWTHLQRPAEQPTPQTVDSLLPQRQPLQGARRPPLGGEQYKKRMTSKSIKTF